MFIYRVKHILIFVYEDIYILHAKQHAMLP